MRARTFLAAGMVLCIGAAGAWFWLTETDGGARFIFAMLMGEAAEQDGVQYGAVGYGEGGLVVRDVVVDGDGEGGSAPLESGTMVLTGFGPFGADATGSRIEFRDFSFSYPIVAPILEGGAATVEVSGLSAVMDGADLPVFVDALLSFQKTGGGIEKFSVDSIRLKNIESKTEGFPGTVQLGSGHIEGVKAGVIDSYRFEGFRFTGDATFDIKTGSVSHIDLTPYGDPKINDLFRSSIVLNRIKALNLSGISATYKGKPVYAIEAITFSQNEAWRGLTTDGQFTVEAMTIDLQAVGSAEAGLPPLDVLRIDVSGRQIWDVEAGRLGLHPMVVEAQKIGRIDLQLDFAGLPSGDKIENFDLSIADLLGVSLERVVVGLSYDEIVDQMIEASVQNQDRGRQGSAELFAAIAAMQGQKLGEQRAGELAESIKTFIATPGKTFVVKLDPDEPIPFLQFATMGQQDPATIERKLGQMLGLSFSVR